jgi:hypothetical protein
MEATGDLMSGAGRCTSDAYQFDYRLASWRFSL